jgi:protein ImuB
MDRLERLIRLRLETIELPSPVVRLLLSAEAVQTDREQSELFSFSRTPELKKAENAIAEIEAELGPDSVSVARIENSHLPEHTFSWNSVGRLRPPRPQSASSAGDGGDQPRTATLVRRMLAEPVALDTPPAALRLVPKVDGPYELSGGWWDRPYVRQYYYLTDQTGRLLWIYYDQPAQRWMVQGIIE